MALLDVMVTHIIILLNLLDAFKILRLASRSGSSDARLKDLGQRVSQSTSFLRAAADGTPTKTVKSRQRLGSPEHRTALKSQLTLLVVWTLWRFVEPTLDKTVGFVLPLYGTFKLTFLFWFLATRTYGATQLFNTILRPLVLPHEPFLDSFALHTMSLSRTCIFLLSLPFAHLIATWNNTVTPALKSLFATKAQLAEVTLGQQQQQPLPQRFVPPPRRPRGSGQGGSGNIGSRLPSARSTSAASTTGRAASMSAFSSGAARFPSELTSSATQLRVTSQQRPRIPLSTSSDPPEAALSRLAAVAPPPVGFATSAEAAAEPSGSFSALRMREPPMLLPQFAFIPDSPVPQPQPSLLDLASPRPPGAFSAAQHPNSSSYSDVALSNGLSIFESSSQSGSSRQSLGAVRGPLTASRFGPVNTSSSMEVPHRLQSSASHSSLSRLSDSADSYVNQIVPPPSRYKGKRRRVSDLPVARLQPAAASSQETDTGDEDIHGQEQVEKGEAHAGLDENLGAGREKRSAADTHGEDRYKAGMHTSSPTTPGKRKRGQQPNQADDVRPPPRKTTRTIAGPTVRKKSTSGPTIRPPKQKAIQQGGDAAAASASARHGTVRTAPKRHVEERVTSAAPAKRQAAKVVTTTGRNAGGKAASKAGSTAEKFNGERGTSQPGTSDGRRTTRASARKTGIQ